MVREIPITGPLIGAISCALPFFILIGIFCPSICYADYMIETFYPVPIINLILGAAIGYLMFKNNQFVVEQQVTVKIITVAFLAGFCGAILFFLILNFYVYPLLADAFGFLSDRTDLVLAICVHLHVSGSPGTLTDFGVPNVPTLM